MPIGLKFQREHRQLGYHIKYLYYFSQEEMCCRKEYHMGA